MVSFLFIRQSISIGSINHTLIICIIINDSFTSSHFSTLCSSELAVVSELHHEGEKKILTAFQKKIKNQSFRA